MDRTPDSVFWREVVSDGRASSYLVTECPVPGVGSEDGPPAAADLALSLAHAFFEGISACSAGLFAASYSVDPPRGERPPLIRDAALHPRGLPWIPLIRLGSPRLWQSHDHAFLVYPVTGGPLTRLPSRTRRSVAESPPASLPRQDDGSTTAATAPADPRSPGVWDLGALAFEVLRFGATMHLSVMVCDYPPRLVGSGESLARNALYGLTQSPVHRLLVARFLQGAAQQVAGPRRSATIDHPLDDGPAGGTFQGL